MPTADPTLEPPRRHEFVVAALLALLLGLSVVGRPAWDSELVYCATDTATCQAPWSVREAPRNWQLSDSGVAFYPHYELLARRWRSGEAPLWNPDLYAGVPLLANMQWGALDPQVLFLVLLEAWGGERLFDLGLAWSAVLRLALAALGTFLYARARGIPIAGAALAGAGYALSGSLALWLGFSLSHVSPFLPWVLLGVEGLGRPDRRVRSFTTAALALALAILGGHPEVAFFVGFGAGVLALVVHRRDPRARVLSLLALATGTLLAAPALVPFVEYLRHSGALLAHQLAPLRRGMPDLVSLGALLACWAFFARWGRAVGEAEGDRRGRSALLTLGIALAWCGLFAILARRGAQFDLGLGPVGSLEVASLRLGLPVLALVFGAWSLGLSTTRSTGAAPFSLLLPLLVAGAPGLIELWRWLPLVGLAAPARAACLAAFAVCVLAGAALHRLPRAGRRAGAASVAGLLLLSVFAGRLPGPQVPAGLLDGSDEVLRLDGDAGSLRFDDVAQLSGALHGGLQVDELRLGFERLDGGGARVERADFRRHLIPAPADAEGVRHFDSGELDLRPLGRGHWVVTLEFLRAGEVTATRRPALVRVGSADLPGPGTWLWALVVLALVAGPAVGWRHGLLVAALVAQGVLQARAWNPSVPRAEHFRATETEAFLRGLLVDPLTGSGRLMAARGILPANTTLLAGLATIDGYDAMDVDTFDGFRPYALKPGRSPLLDWDAEGVDLGSPAFRLFGVRALLLHTQRELPGWTLVAGPRDAPDRAEVFVYEANAPLEREFCVSRLRPRSEVLADPAGFDPAREVFLEEPVEFELERPFTSSRVVTVERAPERLVFEVELDGEGLFVSTEQHFPGWRLEVNGQERPILRANSIFRGVFLEEGTHRLEFTYEPASWRLGKALGALGLLLLALGVWRARQPSRSTP